MYFLCVALIIAALFEGGEALEGRELYDYMVMFMENHWTEVAYQKPIDSILESSKWSTLDMQYGPWTPPEQSRPPVPTPPPPVLPSKKKK